MSVFKFWVIFLLYINLLYSWGQNIQSFRSDFSQIIESQEGRKVSYSGNIEAKAPNLVKWTYLKPLKKEIFIRGEDVVIYEPSLYQATISHLKQKTDFLSILKKATLQKDGRYRSDIGHNSYFLTLKNGKPYSLEFIDELENKIYIEFKKVLINSNINDKDFIFIPKEGIDIIQQ
ncbi:LolA-like outer membrane lipoprotein chaperone [Helicobacter sp. 13S00477-4]|uniref:LolA-like outer membrane lipoprotein chaperone n=1 Tax=Helicobacter sp. 13S00477-4 TaxID=1905759 RepID=UPI000BA521AD|nr:LolA-like outer membrane lipoprotein chaperone [Helicobacter sp. 13S00477-4]PAF50606.1 hypothetical protein BKH44_07550 [Helicobacter sp. 13S00477-4]